MFAEPLNSLVVLAPLIIVGVDIIRRPAGRFPFGRKPLWAIGVPALVLLWLMLRATFYSELFLESNQPVALGVSLFVAMVYLLRVRMWGGPARPHGVLYRLLSPARRVLRPVARRFRDLPLSWKLATSLVALLGAMGAAGGFVVVQDLTSRAHVALTEEGKARAALVEKELNYDEVVRPFVEAVAAEPAIGDAILARDRGALGRLLSTIMSNTPQAEFLGVADTAGRKLFKLSRNGLGEGVDSLFRPIPPDELSDTNWAGGIEKIGTSRVVGYVRPYDRDGRVVGVVVGAISLRTMLERATSRVLAGVGYYEGDGSLVASAEYANLPQVQPPKRRPVPLPSNLFCQGPPVQSCAEHERLMNPPAVRTGINSSGDDVYTVVYTIGGEGPHKTPRSIAISLPSTPALAAAAGARWRLVGLLGAMMLALLMVGAALSRVVLRQVEPLVQSARALGAGDLSARVPILSGDEHGELARTFNAMAEDLQRSTDEVRRASQAKSEFFAHVSHELRTPLFVIGGNAEMLLDPAMRPKDALSAKEMGVVIKEAGDQMLGLVNEILDLTKLEAGRLELHTEDIDLASEVAELRSSIETLAKRAKLTIAFEVPKRSPQLHGDRRRIREIIQNLCSNAIKYTPAGGRVGVRVAEEDGHVVLTVSDTGVGIPADAQAHIFEPFYRVKGSEPRGGMASSGLGLSITKRLVEAHGGTIEFESEPGKGTTFKVRLPASGAR